MGGALHTKSKPLLTCKVPSGSGGDDTAEAGIVVDTETYNFIMFTRASLTSSKHLTNYFA